MKKTFVCAAGVAILGLAAFTALAGEEHCTLETLHGTMAFAFLSTNNGSPRSGSGEESYDGKGHVKYYQFDSTGLQSYTFSGTGTYTITDNCIATVTYDGGGVPWVYFVSPDGEHYYWNDNRNIGLISAGRADRITKALLVQ